MFLEKDSTVSVQHCQNEEERTGERSGEEGEKTCKVKKEQIAEEEKNVKD